MITALMKIIRITLAVLIVIPSLLCASLEVRSVTKAQDLPEPFCGAWRSGDWLVSNGRFLALVGGTDRTLKTTLNLPTGSLKGSIIGFVPAGKGLANTLIIGTPALLIKDRTRYLTYESARPLPGQAGRTLSLECDARYGDANGLKARVKTTYRFSAGSDRIEILSTLTNTGTAAFKDLGFYIYFNAQSSYSFNPYNRERFPGLNIRVYQKPGHFLGWINPNPLPSEDDPLPGTLAPGASYAVRYYLFVDEKPETLLASIYRELNVKPLTARLFFEEYRGDRLEVIVRDPVSTSTFFRAFLENRPGQDAVLPAGIYEVTANLFPAVAKKYLNVTPGVAAECVFKAPALATVKLKLQDRLGKPVPGKVTFIGLSPTPTPYFQPTDPIATGRGWEGFRNHVFPKAKSEEVALPAGSYLVTASCGPEYSIEEEVVSLLENDSREIVMTIDRAVPTPGLIGLDPHLHTQFSDGSNRIPDRVLSLAAEGVDVAVATDHNFVNDYAPALAELGLQDRLAVLSGTEVTAPDNFIHFNVYPLTPAPDEDNNGAVSALGGSPEALLAAAREKSASALRQLNHPRSGSLGFFNNYNLDPEAAASASPGFSTDFDVMEAMNGPVFYGGNDRAVADWLHLLNRGYFFPVVGSSDTHAIDGEEPGYSRTYVRYTGGEGRALDRSALFDAVRKGRSFVSNGPIVELKVDDRAESGDTLTSRDGKVSVQIEVRGAPWLDVDEVCLIINGEPGLIFPVEPSHGAVGKFRQRVGLTLARDSYIICQVMGRRPLYPVVQVNARSAEEAALPYAITNPVFIDVDGNGRYDAPLPREIRIGDGARKP
jgi:hypothetical protein